MMSKFHKSAILTGSVDSYCLVCESHLKTEDDVNSHIAKPIHGKNLEGAPYVDKYKEDHIRKVKKGYFCEFCNLLLSTAAKVGLHIAEPKHSDNKTFLMLRRIGNYVVAFENVAITEKAWHGLMDNTCLICNTEFDNEGIHKTESSHVLNLVQSKIEFGSAKSVFRKVDESTYQCLTCNSVLTAIGKHLEDPEHKKLYQQCCNMDEVKAKNNTNSAEKKPQKEIISESKKSEVTNGIDHSKTVNNQKEPPKPSEVNKAKQDNSKTEKPKEVVSKPITKYNLESLEASNFILDGDDAGHKSCCLCDWQMPLSAIAYHIESPHHQKLLKAHKKRIRKLKSKNATEILSQVETNNEDTIPEVPENKAEQENRDKIIESLVKFQTSDMKIDFELAKAICKKCSNDIKFNYDAIKHHIETHKVNKQNKKMEPKKEAVAVKKDENDNKITEKPEKVSADTVEAKIFAQQNGLTFVAECNNVSVHCKACDTKVPSALKSMKEHVSGASHKAKTEKHVVCKTEEPVIEKEPFKEFLDHLTTVENLFYKDIIINEKFCINILSFLMITKRGSKLRCQVCEMNMDAAYVDSHTDTPRHEYAMQETPVVKSIADEFIREVRPGIFHCGVCNFIETSWEGLNNHLKSTTHHESKTSANWRLNQHMPQIIEQRERNKLELHMLMRMLLLGGGGNPFF